MRGTRRAVRVIGSSVNAVPFARIGRDGDRLHVSTGIQPAEPEDRLLTAHASGAIAIEASGRGLLDTRAVAKHLRHCGGRVGGERRVGDDRSCEHIARERSSTGTSPPQCVRPRGAPDPGRQRPSDVPARRLRRRTAAQDRPRHTHVPISWPLLLHAVARLRPYEPDGTGKSVFADDDIRERGRLLAMCSHRSSRRRARQPLPARPRPGRCFLASPALPHTRADRTPSPLPHHPPGSSRHAANARARVASSAATLAAPWR